jgi:Sugar phosphate isomerases/epimerases
MKACYNEATTLQNSDLEKDIVLAEKAGFEYIELWIVQIEKYLETHSSEEMVKLFEGRRIKPFAIDSFEDILFNDEYEKLKEKFVRVCEYGKILDVHNIVMVPTVKKGINKQYTKEEIDKEAVCVLTELAELGDPYGMRLAFEPIGFADCTVRSIRHAWKIVQKADRKNIGLTLDVFNDYLYNGLQDIESIKEIDGEKIFIFHIDDAPVLPLDQYKVNHSDRVLPGAGGLPYRRFIKLLKEQGFDIEASIELFNPTFYMMEPETVIDMAFKYLVLARK